MHKNHAEQTCLCVCDVYLFSFQFIHGVYQVNLNQTKFICILMLELPTNQCVFIALHIFLPY